MDANVTPAAIKAATRTIQRTVHLVGILALRGLTVFAVILVIVNVPMARMQLFARMRWRFARGDLVIVRQSIPLVGIAV